MTSNQNLVEISGLYKSYHRGEEHIPVLDDIALTVASGEFLALMGPSGSGKSTLLHLVAGLDRADTGRLIVAGVDITRLTEVELAAWRARTIGFIFQFYNLIPVLTAFENVELPLLLTPLGKHQRRQHVSLALSLVGLDNRKGHTPGQLSGGQQQRVAIARALVTDPTLIAADEPTGDLDKVSASEVLDLLVRLNVEYGKTILMVTHDPRAAARARRVLHLDKGVLAPV